MVKKHKHISDSDDHSVIDSSDSAGMNTENPHPDDRESNTDSVENVDSADNVGHSFLTRNPPIRFGEVYTHRKKTYEGGEDMWYMPWTLYGLCLCGLCIWTLYVTFIYTFKVGFFLISMQATPLILSQ